MAITQLWRTFIDRARTMAGIRRERQLPTTNGKPTPGSSIVKDAQRIRVKHTIDDDLWKWLHTMGWRPMPVHNNRRRYTVIRGSAFEKLVQAEPLLRPGIYNLIIADPGPQRGESVSKSAHKTAP